MNPKGFVVSRNKLLSEFFTATSSYERPTWTRIDEATVYLTEERAHAALTKLTKRGNILCVIRPIEDLMEAEAPPSRLKATPNDEPATGMVAAEQGEVCADCEHDPCTCEVDLEDDPGADAAKKEVDAIREAKSESTSEEAEEEVDVGDAEDEEEEVEVVEESKDVEVLKFNEPAISDDIATAPDLVPDNEKVKVPESIKSALKSAIADFTKQAQNATNDAQASFCNTTADAMQELLDNLELGTSMGMKQAQVLMTSLMNPITSRIPTDVYKFIVLGGRKPSLQMRFYEAHNNKKEMIGSQNSSNLTALQAARRELADLRDMYDALKRPRSEEDEERRDEIEASIKKQEEKIRKIEATAIMLRRMAGPGTKRYD